MKAYAYLAGLLAALAGFLALMFGARKAGRDAAENEAKGEVLEKVEKAARARRNPDNSGVRKFDRD